MADSDRSPSEILMQMARGLWLSRAVWAAARLRLADAVGEQAVPAADIAAATGTNPDAVGRLLTALSTSGVFKATSEGFEHTPVSQLLRSDHPASQRLLVEALVGHDHYEAWGMLDETVRTGATGFDLRFGKPIFDYYAEHPEAARRFGEAMTSFTRTVEEAVLSAHDFGSFKLGIDVGGSEGSMLRRILARTPDAQGIIFDLPGTAKNSEEAWRDAPEASRLRAVGGDFFEAVPEGDFYLLKHILHDWNDEKSGLILRNIRKAIRPDGRIAIVEMVLPEAQVPHFGWLFDLNMLVLTSGRERRLSEYAALLAAAGFGVDGMTPTPSPMSVITASPL